MIETVAIVGMGLMGGSLGRALRARRLARHVVGIDRQAEARRGALEVGAADRTTTELDGVREADLIVLATPVPTLPALLAHLVPYVGPHALLTDLGSVKARIVEAGERLYGTRFIGGHPMAGSEQSGIESSRADLFQGAAWAIVRSTPVALDTDGEARRLHELAIALGARPVLLNAAQHDRLVALVSHLPHLLSFAFAHTVQSHDSEAVARQLAGGSFRDMIRVAASDPALWQGIFAENRSALLDSLSAYQTRLRMLQETLEREDWHALLALLEKPA
jgi:prephenate dehydrogenase